MANSRTIGRISGQSNDRNWLGEVGRERRYNHAHGVAKSAIGRKGKCPKCGCQNICTDGKVTPGNGAKSWWVCQKCGHVATCTITPEQMAQYYENAGRKVPA